MPPPTPTDPYPPFPLEVDDEYIYHDRVDPQPEGIVSKITGFNLNIRIYLATTPLSTMELAYGIDEVFDWVRQKRVLEECLRNCKHALDQAPRELLLLPGSAPGEFPNANQQYFPPTAEYPGLRTNGEKAADWQTTQPENRRQLQYEIQKANIYASQLGTRSYIVEKYCNLQEVHEKMTTTDGGESQLSSPGVLARGLDGMLPKTSTTGSDIETNISDEKDNIVKDLLRVLSSISQVNMEPNGGSFVRLIFSLALQLFFFPSIPLTLATTKINKIRQIASTLINTPQNRKGAATIDNEEYLKRFLDVLMKLERVSPSGDGSVDGAVDEEEELRNWADLREYQMKFAEAGGFLSQL